MDHVMDRIITLEWNFAGQLDPLPGPCDKELFQRNRRNYLSALAPEILENYCRDLEGAWEEGRNPMEERRDALAAQTAPDRSSKGGMPRHSPEKDYLLDWISRALATWQERLAAEYPRLIGKRPPIRREKESGGQASFETLMWSELAACSVITLRSYAAYVERLEKAGGNLNQMIWENIAASCGCASLKEAESRLLHNV